MGGSLGPFSKGTYGTFRDLLGGHGSFGSFSKGTEKNMKRYYYYMVNFDGFFGRKKVEIIIFLGGSWVIWLIFERYLWYLS